MKGECDGDPSFFTSGVEDNKSQKDHPKKKVKGAAAANNINSTLLLPSNYALERFLPTDLQLLKQVNVDHLSETYSLECYMHYLIRYPPLCLVVHYYHGYTCGLQEAITCNDKVCENFDDLLAKGTTANDKGEEEEEEEQLAAYILGRADYIPIQHRSMENRKERNDKRFLNGHVSALSVGPQHRRRRLATKLMQSFERACERLGCWYVDLFVRPSNQVAIDMYHQMGYVIYRRIYGYYGGKLPEDAFDMRKSLSRDIEHEFMKGASEHIIILADELDHTQDYLNERRGQDINTDKVK